MRYLFFLIFFCSFATSSAQESITLTAPIPSINAYVPGSLLIEILPHPAISVVIVHMASGKSERFIYPCETPCAFDTEAAVVKMIAGLNTANLSTRSLWRRVFDRLIVDFPARFAGGATVE